MLTRLQDGSGPFGLWDYPARELTTPRSGWERGLPARGDSQPVPRARSREGAKMG